MKQLTCNTCGKELNIFIRLFYKKDYTIEKGAVYDCPKCDKQLKEAYRDWRSSSHKYLINERPMSLSDKIFYTSVKVKE